MYDELGGKGIIFSGGQGRAAFIEIIIRVSNSTEILVMWWCGPGPGPVLFPLTTPHTFLRVTPKTQRNIAPTLTARGSQEPTAVKTTHGVSHSLRTSHNSGRSCVAHAPTPLYSYGPHKKFVGTILYHVDRQQPSHSATRVFWRLRVPFLQLSFEKYLINLFCTWYSINLYFFIIKWSINFI